MRGAVQAARSFASRAAPGGAGVLTQHHKRSVSLHGSSGYSTRAVLTARALGLGLVAGQGQGCVACGPEPVHSRRLFQSQGKCLRIEVGAR